VGKRLAKVREKGEIALGKVMSRRGGCKNKRVRSSHRMATTTGGNVANCSKKKKKGRSKTTVKKKG